MQAKTLVPTSMHGARMLFATLLLALTGAVASLAHAQAATPPTSPAPAFGHHEFGGGRMLERMLDSVNASADQRSRIHDIMKSAMTDLRAQREASRGLREQALNLFAQPTVDARAVESVRQQMLQQHDQSSRRWMQAMLDASAVLSPDQRAQLAERMKQRSEMMQQRQRRTQEQPKG
ncbi:MAG TPA: Spy/CpxP family protein refolding chaperone [Burkholderiaceae bacterium]|nr:Spy/CpxP family protein refolding chaperone [Burkholderiaceae bacterium]